MHGETKMNRRTSRVGSLLMIIAAVVSAGHMAPAQEPDKAPAELKDLPISQLPVSKPYTGPLAKYDPARELGAYEARPEFPDKPLRRYLYLHMKDSSTCGSYDRNIGIMVLDIDNGHRFVKRITSDLLVRGKTSGTSIGGVRAVGGSAETDRIYYGYANSGRGFKLAGGRQAGKDSACVIGCVDLRTDRVLWEQPSPGSLNVACFANGTRLLAGTGGKTDSEGTMWIWDAIEGRVLEEVKGFQGHGHGISRGPTWRFLYPEIYKNPIKLFDVKRKVAISLAEAFAFDSLDDFEGWWGKPIPTFPPFNAGVIPNGAETVLAVQLWKGKAAGLQFFDLVSKRTVLVDLDCPLLHHSALPGPMKRLYGFQGYQPVLSADEQWVYLGNEHHHHRVCVFDNSTWPPRFVGVMGSGLTSKQDKDPIWGLTVGCRNKGGAWPSADGSIVYTSDSRYFDTGTWKPMGMFRNEDGRAIRCTKFQEVHFRGEDAVYVGERYGFGRYKEPQKVFPPPTDKTPPSGIYDLEAAVDEPSARRANGTVVAAVHLSWSPATDNEGVQRYAVYRDGDLIGNCLGVNPDIDPVMSPEDQAEYERQVGKFQANTFVARYQEPGRTYRFEVEPIDFAQNRGPRTAFEVAVPAVEEATAERLVRTWAETVIAKVKENPKAGKAVGGLVSGLKPMVDRPWARAVLEQVLDLPGKRVDWRQRHEVRELLKGSDPE